MKKTLCVFVLLAVLLSLGTAGADPVLTIQDTAVRPGPVREAYVRILEEKEAGIRAYEAYVPSVTYSKECHPVGLTDLTGDGIPELMFLELIDETEYGFRVGRLSVYTADAAGVHCALSLQPEIDDLLYSSLYLGKDGLLTVHLSDLESGWVLTLRADRNGQYAAETILLSQEDFSGDGPDRYFLNGERISEKKYKSALKSIQSAQGELVGSLNVDEGRTGFAYTWEEARREILSREDLAIAQSAETKGSVSEEPLPTLRFSPGTFTPGQRFAVYSAPSDRSWRGAKGKAAITSGSEILVAGEDGGWILIFYELNSGLIRVGYVDTGEISGDYTAGETLSFARKPMKLVKSAKLTDDPIRRKTSMAKLKKGTEVTGLAEYEGMVYVETTISGKTARGFLPPDALGME